MKNRFNENPDLLTGVRVTFITYRVYPKSADINSVSALQV